MSYLERLDAMIVVIATPEHAARLGPALEARFLEEFRLEPFSDEDIATMIDVRVRRENQLGWRPHPSWIEQHLRPSPVSSSVARRDEQAIHGAPTQRPAFTCVVASVGEP